MHNTRHTLVARSARMTLASLCAFAAIGGPGAAQAVPRTDLAPHKAIYNIKMTAKKSSAPILNISGEMFFELKAGCDAWTTDHRFNLSYEYAEGGPVAVSSDFTTYETYDGRTLDFSTRRHRNGTLFEEVRGRAETDATGGTASFSLPEGTSYKLAPGTLYAMGHTAALREQMVAGKKFFNATIFDGSDADGPVEINAFIGKAVKAPVPATGSSDIDAALIARPAHKVRMAFFPLTQAESSPDYEMDAIFHDNGIISDMTVEYKEFTVHQSLKALQAGIPEICDGKQHKTGVQPQKPANLP